MDREETLSRVAGRLEPWDAIVIGGGATGVGCALDAASRGFGVLLLEGADFGKGTSSRSTKLVHGGVRYLAQGNLSLVREALKERRILLKNAPHVVHKTAFIVPCYSLWQKFYYGAGLKIYDLLSGKHALGKPRLLSREETIDHLTNIDPGGLRGGVMYFDGQFDDTRLLIDLVRTAQNQGAAVLNYAKVTGLIKDERGRITGVEFEDALTGAKCEARARAVINATGAFCDPVRKMSDAVVKEMVTLSQGVHIILDGSFISTDNALMIPRTPDGRVLFVIPWHGHTLVGTTDTPIDTARLEPEARESEIEFILETAGKYLAKKPRREDILSVFTGIRPLVKSAGSKNTAALSRGHTIETDTSGLLTITGGKWTTYRSMAEDAINQAIRLGGLQHRPCITGDLRIINEQEGGIEDLVANDPALSRQLHPDLPYAAAEVIWAIRNEMAQTVEDVLARRTRALFLNTNAALEMAPAVAETMARELGKSENWTTNQVREFEKLAKRYLPET
jgi:glycerol-3-phosphate dehydrogenase